MTKYLSETSHCESIQIVGAETGHGRTHTGTSPEFMCTSSGRGVRSCSPTRGSLEFPLIHFTGLIPQEFESRRTKGDQTEPNRPYMRYVR